jgi:hypothetical protein
MLLQLRLPLRNYTFTCLRMRQAIHPSSRPPGHSLIQLSIYSPSKPPSHSLVQLSIHSSSKPPSHSLAELSIHSSIKPLTCPSFHSHNIHPAKLTSHRDQKVPGRLYIVRTHRNESCGIHSTTKYVVSNIIHKDAPARSCVLQMGAPLEMMMDGWALSLRSGPTSPSLVNLSTAFSPSLSQDLFVIRRQTRL